MEVLDNKVIIVQHFESVSIFFINAQKKIPILSEQKRNELHNLTQS